MNYSDGVKYLCIIHEGLIRPKNKQTNKKKGFRKLLLQSFRYLNATSIVIYCISEPYSFIILMQYSDFGQLVLT